MFFIDYEGVSDSYSIGVVYIGFVIRINENLIIMINFLDVVISC